MRLGPLSKVPQFQSNRLPCGSIREVSLFAAHCLFLLIFGPYRTLIGPPETNPRASVVELNSSQSNDIGP